MTGADLDADAAAAFELRGVDHTDLFGAFLAVHALPGSVLLLHTTVGCKFKTQMHLVGHDWMRESHNQRLWTGVDDVRLIEGSGRRLVEFATSWYERRKPSLFLVATNAAVELSSFDVETAVERLRESLPCPVVLLRTPGFEGSLWRGYRRVVEVAAGLVDWSRPPEPDAVALVGYLFDRFEMDHAANLAELRRLLAAIGLKLAATLLSGEDLDRVREASRAGTLLVLPYAHALEASLVARTGRRVAPVDLPVGLAGTAAFLRAAGRAAGVDPARVEAAIDAELRRAVPRVAPAAAALSGLAAGVFLDTPLAAAAWTWLGELGVDVPLVCLTDGEEASEAAFRAATVRLGAPERPAPRVLAGPSRDASVRAFREACAERHLPVVVGSSIQQAAFAGEVVAVVQLGYPSTGKHFFYPVPWMGFAGAIALAQRLVDARTWSF